jgi:hypothetical protein
LIAGRCDGAGRGGVRVWASAALQRANVRLTNSRASDFIDILLN